MVKPRPSGEPRTKLRSAPRRNGVVAHPRQAPTPGALRMAADAQRIADQNAQALRDQSRWWPHYVAW